MLAHVDEAVVACDADWAITFASPSVRPMLGYDPEAVVGRSLVDFLHPDEVEELLESLLRWAGRPGAPRGQVQRVRNAGGDWVPLRYDTVTGAAAEPLGSIIITLREDSAVYAQRADALQRLVGEERIVELASIFAAVDADGFDDALDEALVLLSGLEWVTRLSIWRSEPLRVVLLASWEAAVNQPGGELSASVRLESSWMMRRLAQLEEVHIASVDHLPDDCAMERELFGSWGVHSVLAVPMYRAGAFNGLVMAESTFAGGGLGAGQIVALRAAANIVSAALVRHDVEVELARRARSDVLTGLPNRWAFADALAAATEDVASLRSPGVGVAMVDIDRFKMVNDALGHGAGDRLLGDIATRLAGAVPPESMIARLGGDELLLLHPAAATLDDAVAATREVLAALEPPFEVGGHPVALTASAGVVHSGAGDAAGFVADPEELLRRAHLAMYRAKERGGDQLEIDDEAARASVSQRLRREAELRAAVEGDGLVVHYQAEWDLLSGRIIGAEALARWEHPVDGLLAAGEFIPMAEECGVVVPLGERVLEDACAALGRWRAAGLADDFVLRVNVSALQLRRDGLVARLQAVLREAHVPADALCVELTESTLLADPERSVAVLEELRALGVGLAIDDFGTGFSSMLYLKRLPLTSIKVDRAFVMGLPDDTRDRAIVGSTVELASALGVSITAEGVEDLRQRGALVAMG
ncbi:MAG: EAL domain-containing protein [Acidimicrobiales bacterium]